LWSPPGLVGEALDGGESGGIECGLALRVGSFGAWVMVAVAVMCSDGYRSLLCRQVYQQSGGKVKRQMRTFYSFSGARPHQFAARDGGATRGRPAAPAAARKTVRYSAGAGVRLRGRGGARRRP